MRALVQRVVRASVRVEGEVVGEVGKGLVVLLGVARGDTPSDAQALAHKVAHLRVFPENEKEFHLTSLDIGGEVLVVSQFTLLADTAKGRRPSFTEAAPPQEAQALYQAFVAALRSLGVSKVAMGRFQQHMLVELVNDGPVTLMLDSRAEK